MRPSSPRCGSSGRPDLSVVVVTHNSESVIGPCLTALARGIRGLSVEVVVVDNASTDGTRQIVAAQPATALVANSRNAGFAAACNIGIGTSTGRQVLLLNPDAMVTADAVERLVDGLLRFPEAGMAGPTFRGADGSTRPALEPVPSIGEMFSRLTPLRYLRRLWRPPRSRPRPDTPVATGYLIGACLLIRREVLEGVGKLDEGYLLYWEDMEYARRALHGGWKLLWVSGSVVQHARASSSAGVAAGERHWLSLVGARRYFGVRWKPAGVPGLWAMFKALYVTNALLVCLEGAVKASLHGLIGSRARVARHRQRRADAWAFLRRHLWDLVRL